MKKNKKKNNIDIISLLYNWADVVIGMICIIISLISHSIAVKALSLSINVIILLKVFLRMKGAKI